MKNLSVTNEELLLLMDAVHLLQSAAVFADNRNGLYLKLCKLEDELRKC